MEQVPSSSSASTEEEECEAHFMSTHKRLTSGRFSVRLPLKAGANGLSRTMAVRRLKSQEKKLKDDPEKYQQYREFMNEYLSLGHMQLIENPQQTTSPSWYYLPHHSVIKESSTTTKLRVVFDASARTSTGVSLNDVLMTGPKTQDDLFNILLRVRVHPIALIADVEKMYRQIEVDPSDRDYQRIVWRNSPSDPIQDYQLSTVTYGTGSAPYAATRCLRQLALDEAV